MRQEFRKLRLWAAPLLHRGPQAGDCFLGGGGREGVAQANLLRRPTPPPGALPNPAFYGEEVKPSGLGADERGWGPPGRRELRRGAHAGQALGVANFSPL